MDKTKVRNFFIYLIAAYLLYSSYDILSDFFYYLIYYPFNIDYDWVLAHSTQLDAYFMLVLLPLYLFIFVKASYVKGRPICSKLKMDKLLGSILLIFTINGISKIWFDIVDTFFSNVPILSESMESFDNAFSSLDTESYMWTLISVVIIGPIVEELLFRGILIKTISKIVPENFAVIIAGILFGIWHGILVQTIYTAIMGIIVGYVYVKTRSIIYPIIIHIANNFINGLPPFWDTYNAEVFLSNFSVVCIIPGLIVLYFVFHKHPETDKVPALENNYLE